MKASETSGYNLFEQSNLQQSTLPETTINDSQIRYMQQEGSGDYIAKVNQSQHQSSDMATKATLSKVLQGPHQIDNSLNHDGPAYN